MEVKDMSKKSIRYLACTDSTNTVLASQEKLPLYSTIVAGHQSAGKGRANRSWYAPVNTSLMFSVLVPVPEKDTLSLTTLAAGLGVAYFIEKLIPGFEAKLKWPNDVMIDDKKVAGVLAEHTDQGIIIGVGINLTADIPEALKATSLIDYGFKTHTGEQEVHEKQLIQLAEQAVTYVRQEMQELEKHPSKLLTRYSKKCITLGQEVTVAIPGQENIEGSAEKIAPTGQLVLKTDAGSEMISVGDAHIGSAPKPVTIDLSTVCEECR